MPQPPIPRTARLEARISREALAVVRRAAEIQGRSVSDFVVAAAQEAAQKTVTEIEVIRLSREAQEKFVELLLNPPPLAPALKKAFARHPRRILSGVSPPVLWRLGMIVSKWLATILWRPPVLPWVSFPPTSSKDCPAIQ